MCLRSVMSLGPFHKGCRFAVAPGLNLSADGDPAIGAGGLDDLDIEFVGRSVFDRALNGCFEQALAGRRMESP